MRLARELGTAPHVAQNCTRKGGGAIDGRTGARPRATTAQFVEQDSCDFLHCGWLAGGVARFRGTACDMDRLVAFSCKGFGFCPSCGGRRMTGCAGHRGATFPGRASAAGSSASKFVWPAPPRVRLRAAAAPRSTPQPDGHERFSLEAVPSAAAEGRRAAWECAYGTVRMYRML